MSAIITLSGYRRANPETGIGGSLLLFLPSAPLTFPSARERDEFTDFTLICRSEQFRVHKAVVCAQSKMMSRACTGP